MSTKDKLRHSDLFPLTSSEDPGGSNLPAVIQPKAAPALADFAINAIRTIFSPVRRFALTKAALFTGFTAALFAGKLTAVQLTGARYISVIIADPTLGQTLVLAGTVVTLTYFNLKAIRIVTLAANDNQSLLLQALNSPGLSAKERHEILEKFLR